MISRIEIPEPWKSFLTEIDINLKEETKFYCIGGFVIKMLYNFERETSDLDFIRCLPRDYDNRFYELAGRESELCEEFKVYLDR
jgi:hypothetical protein